MIDVEVYSKAGIGKSNEDYVLHTEIAPGISLIVVCDGMGGLSYGEPTAKIIAHSVEDYLRQNLYSHIPKQSIINALHNSNEVLAKECFRLKAKMGASIALALFMDKTCYYTWLGDVRIYLVQESKTQLLTYDHLAIEGNHSFLTRCINGKEFRYSPEVRELPINDDDKVYIATDGFYLHNDVALMTEPITTADDDATIVRIKLTEELRQSSIINE